MLTPSERKKMKFAKGLFANASAGAQKYEDLYNNFSADGYSKDLCEEYADAFVDESKNPSPIDIIQLSAFYDKIHDNISAEFYLDMLTDKKMNNDEKFEYSILMLKNKSKLGKWRDAVDFRTDNIDFMQKYALKLPVPRQVNMHIANSIVECAAKNYVDAFRLLRDIRYKPTGRNDTTLLNILIMGIYICKISGAAGLLESVDNTRNYLNMFTEFEFGWSKDYYNKKIIDAENGVI